MKINIILAQIACCSGSKGLFEVVQRESKRGLPVSFFVFKEGLLNNNRKNNDAFYLYSA